MIKGTRRLDKSKNLSIRGAHKIIIKIFFSSGKNKKVCSGDLWYCKKRFLNDNHVKKKHYLSICPAVRNYKFELQPLQHDLNINLKSFNRIKKVIVDTILLTLIIHSAAKIKSNITTYRKTSAVVDKYTGNKRKFPNSAPFATAFAPTSTATRITRKLECCRIVPSSN